MMKKLMIMAAAVFVAVVGFFFWYRATDEVTVAEVTVAYFLQWPTPNQVAQLEETYDKEMGVKVKWVAFDTGVAMSAAMASGDVDIAYSQGVSPFVIAVSQGLQIKTVGVAVSYADNDNCVVHKDAGITKENAKKLEGKKVAVPFGTVPYYKVLRQFNHLGVDHKKVNLIDLPPPEGAAALSRGDVAMACGWGGAFGEMKKYGKVLMTSDELADIGVFVFDVVSVTNSFAKSDPDLIVKFLQVTEDANRAYAKDPKKYLPTIAKAAEMNEEKTLENLNAFTFPTKSEQINTWMNGSVAEFYGAVADVLKNSGDIPRTLSDYGTTVDTSYMKKVR